MIAPSIVGSDVSVFTVAPADAPAWAQDPEQLANAMEARETRKNSQLAFECRLALPAALDESDREEIAREFTREVSDRYGVAAIVAIHASDRHGDERNFHAHILFTTRRMEAD
jgi:MobA/MobL family